MLFPADQIAPQRENAELKGIARLAAESRILQAKRRVEYLELPSRSLLNRCSNPHMPFRWTINPYRGCEYGCQYCYARYTHEFMGMAEGRLFEQKIYAKQETARLLRRDLAKNPQGGIAIGTSTDPYQPAERRYQRTRSILEVFAEGTGHDLGITTKSDLIPRDLDLLTRIAERNRLSVNITVTTVDERLARLLEPYAPRPELRLQAVAALSQAGVETGVFLNPIQPGITSSEANLTAVAQAAKQAGASFLGGGLLFLMPSAQQHFLPFVEREFPHLATAYRRHYKQNAYLRGAFAEQLQQMVRRIRRQCGLANRPTAAPVEIAPPPPRQLGLFDAAQE